MNTLSYDFIIDRIYNVSTTSEYTIFDCNIVLLLIIYTIAGKRAFRKKADVMPLYVNGCDCILPEQYAK